MDFSDLASSGQPITHITCSHRLKLSKLINLNIKRIWIVAHFFRLTIKAYCNCIQNLLRVIFATEI